MNKSPIFILACSPRSGSTWLQRTITSTGDALIWGESSPLTFPIADLWSRRDGNDFRNVNDLMKFRTEGTNMWMAVLNPFEDNMNRALKNFFEDMFGQGAIDEGYNRWGKKETSWTDKSVQFLRRAWPKCKIIFLSRRFEASYLSRFPRRDNSTWVPQGFCREADVEEFCSKWIAQISFALSLKDDPNCMLVRYESLFNQQTMQRNEPRINKIMEWLKVGTPDYTKCSKLVSCSNSRKGKKSYPIDTVDWKTVIQKSAQAIRALSKQLKYPDPFNQKVIEK